MKDEQWVRRELLLLANDADVTFPVAHALWMGPELRHAVEEAHQRRTAGAGVVRGEVEEVVVQLERCPVVQVPVRVTQWRAEPYPPPRLLAPDVWAWIEQGGLRDWNQPVGASGGEMRTAQAWRRVREWLHCGDGGQSQGTEAQSGRCQGAQKGQREADEWWDAGKYSAQMALLQADWWRMLRRAAAVMHCRGCGRLLSSHGANPDPPLFICNP